MKQCTVFKQGGELYRMHLECIGNFFDVSPGGGEVMGEVSNFFPFVVV